MCGSSVTKGKHLDVKVLSVGLGVDCFLGLVGWGHGWYQRIGLKWINEAKCNVALGVGCTPFFMTEIEVLMVMWCWDV